MNANQYLLQEINSGDPARVGEGWEALKCFIKVTGHEIWAKQFGHHYILNVNPSVVSQLLNTAEPGNKLLLVSLLLGINPTLMHPESVFYFEILCPSHEVTGGINIIAPYQHSGFPFANDSSLFELEQFTHKNGFINVGRGGDGSDYALNARTGKVSHFEFGRLHTLYSKGNNDLSGAFTMRLSEFLDEFARQDEG